MGNRQKHYINLFNSATGRSTCRANVHLSNSDPNYVYEWATYRKTVIVDSRPCHNSNGYNNIGCYVVRCQGIPIYRGHTIQDPQVRLQEHWDEARTNPTNKVHKFLMN